jgi:hypothetical protein
MNIRRGIALLAAGVVAAAAAAPAWGQATRTWVSGVGDDANPCSRTAPCKTFAGAITKTAAGGEINCLDPGGYGAVTITKSMTISCPYTEGGALAGGNGITINDGTSATPNTAVVYLRGLDIFGVNPPTHGVRFVAGAALHIEDSVIRRFNSANSHGVSFQPGGAAKLYISNSTIADNGNGSSGGGIVIQPTGGGSARAVLKNVRVHNNANIGIRVDTTGNTGGASVTIDDSVIAGSDGGVAVIADTAAIRTMVTDSVIANNGKYGLGASGDGSTVYVGGTTITGNALGVAAEKGSNIVSYGDNRVDGNPASGEPADGAFTGSPRPRR